jgi:hypothetical protein
MIIRLLIDGILSLGRPLTAASLRHPPDTGARSRSGSRTGPPRHGGSFRGRPDLLLMTGALTAPPSIPHRAVRGRSLVLRGPGGRHAA